MRWLVGVFILVLAAVGGAYLYVRELPAKTYSDWINGKGWNNFYEVSNYKTLFLAPVELTEIPTYQEDYVQLWKEFPLRNSLIPLPTRHPLFLTVPIIETRDVKSTPQVGMIILASQGRELSRLYTSPTTLYPDHSQGQELFKLPMARKVIMSKTLDEVWKDIFSYKIEKKTKSFNEMVYDLYILHLRAKLLPAQTLKYGLIKEGKQAMVELASEDKDYMVELIMTQVNGSIYSYVLRTERQNADSVKLRAKFLNSVTFSPIDEAMGRLLYTEFKQLNFARQIDQEGLLYLFSAWSQNPDNVDLLKEMIFYQERGMNKRQLKVLYDFSFKKYGKTFTTRKDMMDQDDPDMALQRKIEIEHREQRDQAEAAKNKPVLNPEMTPDEKMNVYLKKAKEEKKPEAKDMTVH